MNFKIDSFKIRKNSRIIGTFRIQKIRILNLCLERIQETTSLEMADLTRPSVVPALVVSWQFSSQISYYHAQQ